VIFNIIKIKSLILLVKNFTTFKNRRKIKALPIYPQLASASRGSQARFVKN